MLQQRGGAKLAGLALAEGEISSDGANRQRVDADLLAANAKTAFLVSDSYRIGAGMPTVMQLDVSPVLQVCVARHKGVQSSLVFPRRGVVASDGANRQRVDGDFFAANAEAAFLVSDGDGIKCRHVHCNAVGRLARAPFIGVACHEGVQSSLDCLRRECRR